MPFAGVVTAVTVRSSPSASVSLARTSISFAVSNAVRAVSSTATGGALTATRTLAVALSVPSETV